MLKALDQEQISQIQVHTEWLSDLHEEVYSPTSKYR